MEPILIFDDDQEQAAHAAAETDKNRRAPRRKNTRSGATQKTQSAPDTPDASSAPAKGARTRNKKSAAAPAGAAPAGQDVPAASAPAEAPAEAAAPKARRTRAPRKPKASASEASSVTPAGQDAPAASAPAAPASAALAVPAPAAAPATIDPFPLTRYEAPTAPASIAPVPPAQPVPAAETAPLVPASAAEDGLQASPGATPGATPETSRRKRGRRGGHGRGKHGPDAAAPAVVPAQSSAPDTVLPDTAPAAAPQDASAEQPEGQGRPRSRSARRRAAAARRKAEARAAEAQEPAASGVVVRQDDRREADRRQGDERRLGQDRRSGQDRRVSDVLLEGEEDRRLGQDRRSGQDRRAEFERRAEEERRSGLDRRALAAEDGQNRRMDAVLDEMEEDHFVFTDDTDDDVQTPVLPEAPRPARKGRAAPKAEAEPAPRNRRMLVSVLPGELVEVVILEENVVAEYYVEMVHQAKIRGNIYKGVISNVDPNLQAAFVNFGQVKNGFLQIDEVHPEYWLTHYDTEKGAKYPPIQKVLKAGQEVLVQVVKEPAGSKGAFLTTWVSLAGRFLVLTPGQEQIGISRKVEDGEERNRLRELIKGLEPGEGLGAIVRTVSAGTSKTTLQKDLNYLKRVWKGIHKRAGTEAAPSLIYEEPGLASRAVRDYLSEDVSEVWVDDAETAEAMREMVTMLFPRRADMVKLYDNPAKSLWEQFNVRKQIEQVHAREVTLPSGGRLVFDQTEALMAVDINSGRSGGKNNFESTAVRTNLEAAEAIARQLRLRDVGGQVVIDFIEMRDQSKCREVEKTLNNAMKYDRARHDIGRMSSFGLLQIVRQRIGSSAISISQEPCPHCGGTGMRRNMEWQALQLLRELRGQMQLAARNGQHEYSCPLEPELAVYVLNAKRERLTALEKEFGVRLEIRVAAGETR